MELSQQRIRRDLLRLAYPAILEMMLHTTVWIADTAMVGRLGPVELSAVGLGGEIFFTTVFVFAAIGVGATAMIARYYGAKEYKKVHHISSQVFLLGILVGTFVSVLLYFVGDTVIYWFNIPEEVAIQSEIYIKTATVGTFFMLPMFVSIAILRGIGNNQLPLLIAIVINTINIIGDYVLIFGKFGFPAYGVKGAAIAAAAGHIVGAVVIWVYLFSGRLEVKLDLQNIIKFDKEIIKKVLNLSTPAGIAELITNGSRIVFSIMVAHLGAVAYAAHQVAVAAESLSFMPGFGFSIAATTIVGQSLGAKEQVQASKSGWEALKLGLMIMVSIGLFFLILPHQIIKVFIPNPEVIELGASCLRIAAFEQPVIAVEMILSGALKGAGDTRWPLYSALVGNWLIRIPLVYLSVFVFHLPVTFVWIVTVIDFTVRSVIVLWRFKSGKWTAIKI